MHAALNISHIGSFAHNSIVDFSSGPLQDLAKDPRMLQVATHNHFYALDHCTIF